ncbi:hypothetical protein [Leyella stercorea]|uniref:hypothetical protein n=1 Tax=Leyella stercorea TaxID=363265 RepID=UPI002673AE32|nr:hypothetical protein [Leyella stercorea]
MAVTKFVRAQDILKEKGFKVPPFDTAGFQNAVVEFFQKNDVSAKLTIFGVRFVDYEGTPKCGFSDCTQYSSSETWSDGRKSFHYDLPDYLDCRFGYSATTGFSTPFFIVDEPYLTNVVALLKMAGFIVGRKRRVLGVPTYDITLV